MKRLVTAIALAFAAGPALAIDFGKIIDIGRQAVQQPSAKEFSQEDEIALGQAATASFLGASPLHPDASLQRYVNRVGKWVALHSDRSDLPWTFSVIDTETINAFALPGGSIIVSSGLLKRLGSESELAGVLAHEIAHVVKKHQLTAIQSGMQADFWKNVGTSVAADHVRIGGGAVGSTVGNIAKPYILDAAGNLIKDGFFLRPLDRGLESEADQLAIVLATRAGYDPYGLVGALQMLAQYKGGGDAASIFSTHPSATDRIAELEKFVPTMETYTKQPQLLEARFKQNVK
ncbi:MAG TPA: M48 family metalloprotease [Usitatibacter sp.]|nr:M48 family metalloprotease [Usitatibacter sp.]